MRIEPTPPYDVTTGRRQGDFTAACEHWRRQEYRRADLPTELRIELRGSNRLCVDEERVALLPFRGDTSGANQLDEGLDVANSRDVLECDRLFGEERGSDDGKSGVLVA